MTTHDETIDGGAVELIGVCAAARELRRHHSTVSRYVKSHPELNHGTDKRPKVDLDEFRRHHALNTNAARHGSHAGRLFGEGDDHEAGDDLDVGLLAEASESAKAGAEANGGSPAPRSLAAFRAYNLAEDLARKRTDRHEREGLLLPKEAVDAAFFSCGRRVRRKIELIETWADELALTCGGDATALRAALHDRLLAFQADIAAAVAALPGDDEDDDENDDHTADSEVVRGEGDVEDQAA